MFRISSGTFQSIATKLKTSLPSSSMFKPSTASSLGHSDRIGSDYRPKPTIPEPMNRPGLRRRFSVRSTSSEQRRFEVREEKIKRLSREGGTNKKGNFSADNVRRALSLPNINRVGISPFQEAGSTVRKPITPTIPVE